MNEIMEYLLCRGRVLDFLSSKMVVIDPASQSIVQNEIIAVLEQNRENMSGTVNVIAISYFYFLDWMNIILNMLVKD